MYVVHGAFLDLLAVCPEILEADSNRRIEFKSLEGVGQCIRVRDAKLPLLRKVQKYLSKGARADLFHQRAHFDDLSGPAGIIFFIIFVGVGWTSTSSMQRGRGTTGRGVLARREKTSLNKFLINLSGGQVEEVQCRCSEEE